MEINNQQWRALRGALVEAFPTRADLAEMVLFQLNENLDAITGEGPLNHVVLELIRWARARGWLAILVLGARRERPDNARLLQVAQELGLASSLVQASDRDMVPVIPNDASLERLVRDTNAYLSPEQWRTRMAEIEGRVCQVETPFGKGTGFLVGPAMDVLITNYHVMQEVIEKPSRAREVVLRFDFKHRADGITLYEGTQFRLASDWLVDCSPYSQSDLQSATPDTLPAMDELDYAVLRLEDRPGDRPVVGTENTGGLARGAEKVPSEEHLFQQTTPLFIFQHPLGGPLKVALDTDAVISVNENRTRVRYRTNTEPGSSGSPCYDQNWVLVALHHLGDSNYPDLATFNQGIPFSAIRALLRSRGKESIIG
jgi:effector-associated domain 1 (EAD1)-containing protein/trypsin-like peptidase